MTRSGHPLREALGFIGEAAIGLGRLILPRRRPEAALDQLPLEASPFEPKEPPAPAPSPPPKT